MNVNTARICCCKARRLFPPSAGPVYTFAPDGAWAACVSRSGSGVVIHDATGQPRAKLPGLWTDLDTSPDGRWLLAAGHTGYCLWDAASWRPVFEAAQQTADRFFAIHSFSRDGTTLALRTTDDTVTLYRLPDGQPLRQLTLPSRLLVRGLALTRNARKLYVLSTGFRLHCWDLDALDAELRHLGLARPGE